MVASVKGGPVYIVPRGTPYRGLGGTYPGTPCPVTVRTVLPIPPKQTDPSAFPNLRAAACSAAAELLLCHRHCERSQHQHNTTTTSPANTPVVSKIQYSIKTPRLRHRQPAARCCLSPSERRQEACLAAAPAPTRQRSTHCALPRCRISSSSITASPSTQSNLVVRLICHHERSSQRRA